MREKNLLPIFADNYTNGDCPFGMPVCNGVFVLRALRLACGLPNKKKCLFCRYDKMDFTHAIGLGERFFEFDAV